MKKIGKLLGALVVLGIVAVVLAIFGPWILDLPAKAEVTRDIALNQTAFRVPLMEANKAGLSPEVLRKYQVVGKRVTMAQREMKTGYLSYDWVDSDALILVDRTPVTVKWSRDPFQDSESRERKDKGSKDEGLALRMQSKDGPKFAVPFVISALVTEDDAALFQAIYGGKTLADVLDTDVRNFTQSELSTLFASVDLVTCRKKKIEFVQTVCTKTQEHFKPTGVTVQYAGLLEGLIFENRDVQTAIEASYLNRLEGIRLGFAIRAENTRNETATETANTAREIAAIAESVKEPLLLLRLIELSKQHAQLVVNASEKFKSNIPRMVLPGAKEGTSVQLQLDANK